MNRRQRRKQARYAKPAQKSGNGLTVILISALVLALLTVLRFLMFLARHTAPHVGR